MLDGGSEGAGTPLEPGPDSHPPESEGPESQGQAPESELPPSRLPFGGFIRRHKLGFAIGVLITAAATVTLYRYASFDPELYAYRAADTITPVDRSLVGGSGEQLEEVDTESMEKRLERASAMLASLRERFHPDDSACFRYVGDAARKDDEAVASAIVAAGLGGYLNALVRTTATWERDRDNELHAADAASEVIGYLAEAGDVWTRAGVWMHRHDVTQCYAQLRERRRLDGGVVKGGAALPDALEPAARELWKTHGSITTAALVVARRKSRIDLHAGELALVAPGMVTQKDVEHRLGAATRAGHRWMYGELQLVIAFDNAGTVVRVGRGINPGADVFIREDKLRDKELATVTAALGAPAWQLASGEGKTLVYDRGAAKLKIDFVDDTLAIMELWRADMLLQPQSDEGAEATAGDKKAM